MSEPTRDELVEQADAVREAVEASMYYPVAHGEAERLKAMLEETTSDAPTTSRKDLLTVADADNEFHLRKWDRYTEDESYMEMWCGGEWTFDEIDAFTFPMGLLDYERLCLDCYYEKKLATQRMFDDMGSGDE